MLFHNYDTCDIWTFLEREEKSIGIDIKQQLHIISSKKYLKNINGQ